MNTSPFGAAASFGASALKRGLARYFTNAGVTTSVLFGWTARSRKDNQGPGGANRVCVMPGKFDPSTGQPKPVGAGRINRNSAQDFAQTATETYRILAWRDEDVTIAVWAANPELPQDEEQAYGASLLLQMLTIQAIHNAVDPLTQTNAGFGQIEDYGDTTWSLPPGEQAFGREFMLGLVLRVPMLDAPIELAFPQPVIDRGPFLPPPS
jgi:hypothetical protein